MLEVKIQPRKKVTEELVERICMQQNLTSTMKGSLKSIDANTHWHFKNGKVKGVLEITLMHNTGEIILAVHENRNDDWVKTAMQQLERIFNA
jgi:hypothetical protein